MIQRLICIVIVLAASVGLGAPSTATKPATRPSTTQPSTQMVRPISPEELKKQQVLKLTRKALEQFKAKKYTEVEATLAEALVLEPNHVTNIYNMACVKAVTGRKDEALLYLERAADAGFTDFLHIEKDPDLEGLRALEGYKKLIASKDVYQKKDAERALAGMKTQFGSRYLYEVDAEHKLIFVADTDAQTLADVKKWLRAQAKSQWETLFSHKPDQYVSIVLPSLKDYRAIIKQPGVEGIYMPQVRMLIARRLGQVMTHEFTHALHAGDLDAVGQEHPIWIIEGIASMFEAAVFEGEKLVPRDNFRLWMLQSAYRSKRLIPLEKLITWKQSQFVSNATLGYGQASSFMLYLYEKELLRKFYEAYKAGFEKDPTGKATLEAVTGMAMKDLDKDWREWMIKRTPPAMNTGPQGAFIGVQFAQENDGLLIEQVVAKGPGEAAGLKRGDVIVGLNDMDIRDQQSLMPVLKEFKPGDEVTLRVRRGEQYMTVPVTLGKRGAVAAATRPTTRPSRGGR